MHFDLVSFWNYCLAENVSSKKKKIKLIRILHHNILVIQSSFMVYHYLIRSIDVFVNYNWNNHIPTFSIMLNFLIVPYSFWIFIFIQSFLLPREVTQGNLKTKQALPAHISVDDHSLLSWHISRSNLCLVAGMHCSDATERKMEMNIGIYFHSNNVFEKFWYYQIYR